MFYFYRLFSFSSVILAFSQLSALPIGGKVLEGEATFSIFEKQLSITQHSERVVILWEDFSLTNDEKVTFIQPSLESVAINCIKTKIPSKQFGHLSGTGHLSLINSSGIIIGADARIIASSFLGSTLPLTDDDFFTVLDSESEQISNTIAVDSRCNRELSFSGEAEGTLLNLGTIEAARGDVFLIGTWIQNEGFIQAPQGTVGIATGTDVLIHSQEQKKIETSGSLAGARIGNGGKIEAASVEIEGCEGNLYSVAVDHRGSISVTSFEGKGGTVFVSAAPGGVQIEGKICAKNRSDGGEIAINADQIALKEAGSLSADGTEVGNGGKITLIAKDKAHIQGDTQARGGTISGDGGLIGITANRIDFFSSADATSIGNGKHGIFFLDSADFYLALENKIASQNWIDLNIDKPFIKMLNSGMYLILSASSKNALMTDPKESDRFDDIVIGDTIILEGSGTLTLKAERDIVIHSPLVNKGGGFIFNAGRDVYLGAFGEIDQ